MVFARSESIRYALFRRVVSTLREDTYTCRLVPKTHRVAFDIDYLGAEEVSEQKKCCTDLQFSALALLATRVGFANYINSSLATNNLAIWANFLYA